MKKLFLFCLLICCLVSCGDEPQVVRREINDYEITYVSRPKHVWVNLRNIKTGRIHKEVALGKYLDNEQRLKGKIIKLRWVQAKWDDRLYSEFFTPDGDADLHSYFKRYTR